MVHIRAENPLIEKEIKNLINLVEEGGGGFYSKMLIESGDAGELSIKTIEEIAGGKELIRISKDVILPTDQCEITVKGDEFVWEFKKGGSLSDLQKKLFDSMFSLYNFSNKVAFQKKVSFFLNMRKHKEIFEKLIEVRNVPKGYQEYIDRVQSGLEEQDVGQFIADTFIKTRQLGYMDHVRQANVSILMPVIDFMNHNWFGASFSAGRGPRAGDLVVNSRQPVEDSLECYAYYGPMDAMDTFMRYDFADLQAPAVRSVPVDLDVLGLGTIKINSNLGGIYNGKITKDMRLITKFMPNTQLDEDKKELIVSYVFVPYGTSPLALRRVLNHLWAEFFGKLGIKDEVSLDQKKNWIRESEDIIIKSNKAHYTDLLSMVRKAQGQKQEPMSALSELEILCDSQLMKLAAYNLNE